VCSDPVRATLRDADDLRDALKDRHDALVKALLNPATPADDLKAINDRIEELAQQLAKLETGPLHLSLSSELDPDKQTLQWTLGDLKKWLVKTPSDATCAPANPSVGNANGCKTSLTFFALDYSFTDTRAPAASRAIGNPCLFKPGDAMLKGCNDYVTLIVPTYSQLEVKAANDSFGVPAATKLGTASVPMPQWAATALLPLKVGTFKSRTIELTFDDFGGTSKMVWKSDATAENAIGSIASIAEAAAPGLKYLDGSSDLDKMKAEKELLDAQLALNVVRACKAVIDAGGTKCPKDEEEDEE
jgi:hypothetical protein